MKRKQSQAVEMHNLSSRQYLMPGTDLPMTNAIPFNQAEDVDQDGNCDRNHQCECGHVGRHYDWEGHGDHVSNFSYTEARPRRPLVPALNPTRGRK